MGDWVYWTSWSLFLAIFGTMVYYAWWALFYDRPNGRRRCPKCWYDLTYSPDSAPGPPGPPGPPCVICSECGYVPRRERQLLRTRRRWGHLALALLVCLAIAVFVQEQTAKRGWSATLPTLLLLFALPHVDHASLMYHELLDRAETNRLTEAQWIALMQRCAVGDRTAAPPDRQWAERYGMIIRQVRRVLVRDPQTGLIDHERPYLAAEIPLLELPPRIELLTPREVWPEDDPVWLMLSLSEWWPAESEVRLEIAAESGSVRVIHYGPQTHRRRWVGVPLAEPLAGGEAIEVSVSAWHRRGTRQAWRSAGEQRHSVSVRAADPHEQVMAPAADEDGRLAELVGLTFRGDVVRWQSGPSPVRFSYSPRAGFDEQWPNVAIGAVMELQWRDDVARRLEIWWPAGEMTSRTRRRGASEVHWRIDYENLELLSQLDPADERWRMRVRGDRSIALRVPGADLYWDGVLDLPITVREAAGEAPPRDVQVE